MLGSQQPRRLKNSECPAFCRFLDEGCVAALNQVNRLSGCWDMTRRVEDIFISGYYVRKNDPYGAFAEFLNERTVSVTTPPISWLYPQSQTNTQMNKLAK